MNHGWSGRSTISGNVAVPGSGGSIDPINTRGGGIFLAMGGLLLDSVTLTASTPHGIWSDGSGSVTNSIVALQNAGPDPDGFLDFFAGDLSGRLRAMG